MGPTTPHSPGAAPQVSPAVLLRAPPHLNSVRPPSEPASLSPLPRLAPPVQVGGQRDVSKLEPDPSLCGPKSFSTFASPDAPVPPSRIDHTLGPTPRLMPPHSHPCVHTRPLNTYICTHTHVDTCSICPHTHPRIHVHAQSRSTFRRTLQFPVACTLTQALTLMCNTHTFTHPHKGTGLILYTSQLTQPVHSKVDSSVMFIQGT